MAPSRALLRCAAPLKLRQAPRLLAACRIRNKLSSPLAISSAPLTVSSLGSSRHSAPPAHRRMYSQPSSSPEPPDYLSEGELEVFNKIKVELDPVRLEVQDISGGCGSMYALDIESARFKGLPVIKQHKLVNQVLADEIKKWHGVQLKTRAP
ncbi:bola-like protein [Lepidopterella palustris CBS 459.81]|uniref:Bola-like protein n=1 Tax=Lepidopterella palustris CBS 459.81 TaxID=1314670 RepID=A0A8E2EFJ9_9PEZI|nr:bola-like protein [Lepidopterella palustris CBS 459.81]